MARYRIHLPNRAAPSASRTSQQNQQDFQKPISQIAHVLPSFL
ncbi:MAG: hypothetical protein ACLU41_11140 [Anaerotignum lactatifermentans]